jgi:uncharacterized membrane protein YeaQ/YmgE (transglycosylase-associated protein family)
MFTILFVSIASGAILGWIAFLLTTGHLFSLIINIVFGIIGAIVSVLITIELDYCFYNVFEAIIPAGIGAAVILFLVHIIKNKLFYSD